MRAQNLSVCVPDTGCDKNCPYCVSEMTGRMITDRAAMQRNLPKVLSLARLAGVSSVLLTGKGEPCRDFDDVVWLLDAFGHLPVELQTNGLRLLRRFARDPDVGDLERLRQRGLDVLAFSLDELEQFERMAPLFGRAAGLGLVIRVTFNLTDRIPADTSLDTFLSACRSAGVQQFSLRQVTVPNDVQLDSAEARQTAAWIEEHVAPGLYTRLVDELVAGQPRLIRRLPYGAVVYDVAGVAVSHFDYCVQDDHGPEDIRSLIFAEDGHLYTAWNSPASILF